MKQIASGAGLRLSYRKIRDVTTPDEEESGASTYVVVLSSEEIVKVGTDGNLRGYIPAHPGKKRSLVHKAIGKTIRNQPGRFAQLNSGFLIGASRVDVDDQKKVITLFDASVNNGAQSQGEIELHIEEIKDSAEQTQPFFVRAEISVEPDAAMRTEIAIARNTTTRIQDISQAGKRGYFDELDNAFKAVHPSLGLARSETDTDEEFVDTRLLLQVLWAMIPQELMPQGRTTIEARMRAYKNAAYCLSDFETVYLERNDDPNQAKRYRYFIDMAGTAWSTHRLWATHKDWEGRRLHADAGQVKRRKGQIWVPDGIVFPILAALSNFVVFDKGCNRWLLRQPSVFRDEDMLEAARRQLKQHQGKPVYMGRSGAAYESLMLLTEMAVRYADTATLSA